MSSLSKLWNKEGNCPVLAEGRMKDSSAATSVTWRGRGHGGAGGAKTLPHRPDSPHLNQVR